MCTTCGCDGDEVHHGHGHGHGHDDRHAAPAHGSRPAERRVLATELDVLAKSQRLAESNRSWLRRRGVTMFNLMSSPGAGKTTLVTRMVRDLGARGVPIFVIEGDQATSLDADRVRAAGARAIQVNTGAGCHLDPHMVAHALEDLDPPQGALVLVENVGNLVCPALFDLGESERVVVASTPEGDDKPLKYPHMFQTASLVVLNKVDLLGVLPFDLDVFAANVRVAAPRAGLVTLTAWQDPRRPPGGVDRGLNAFYTWTCARLGQARPIPRPIESRP